MSTFVTVMMAICFLVVPYACLRFGMERRTWRHAFLLIILSASATPAVTTAASYMRWRHERRSFRENPPPVSIREEVQGEDKTWVQGKFHDGKAEYVLPDGNVLRVPPPEWTPFRNYEVRPDQIAVLGGAAVFLGCAGYVLGRMIARRRAAPRPAVPS